MAREIYDLWLVGVLSLHRLSVSKIYPVLVLQHLPSKLLQNSFVYNPLKKVFGIILIIFGSATFEIAN